MLKYIPGSLDKPIITISYQDANLYHNIITKRSLTIILNFHNSLFQCLIVLFAQNNV